MIRSRKGMVSTLDAVIFITILAVVASGMVMLPEEGSDEPDIAMICDTVFDSRLPVSSVFPEGGDTVYSLKDLTAMALSTGSKDKVSSYLEASLEDSIGMRNGFYLIASYGNASLFAGDGRGDCISAYTVDYDVMGDVALRIVLKVYA